MPELMPGSCYAWLNTSLQVELETTKLLKFAKSLKGHSTFAMSTTSWLGFNISDIFICLPTGIRAVLRSGLQIILLTIVLICLMYLSQPVGVLYNQVYKTPYKDSSDGCMKNRNDTPTHYLL